MPTSVSSNLFTVTDKVLTCEISTLNANGVPGHPRNISVRSERTGTVVTFTLYNARRDNEGDYLYWVYKPVDAQLAQNGVLVQIFND